MCYLCVVRAKIRLLVVIPPQGDPPRAARLTEYPLEPAEPLAHDLCTRAQRTVVVYWREVQWSRAVTGRGET